MEIDQLESIKWLADNGHTSIDVATMNIRDLLVYIDELLKVVKAANAWLAADDDAEAAEACSFTSGRAPIKWKKSKAARERFRTALGGRAMTRDELEAIMKRESGRDARAMLMGQTHADRTALLAYDAATQEKL